MMINFFECFLVIQLYIKILFCSVDQSIICLLLCCRFLSIKRLFPNVLLVMVVKQYKVLNFFFQTSKSKYVRIEKYNYSIVCFCHENLGTSNSIIYGVSITNHEELCIEHSSMITSLCSGTKTSR
jgi:hypothetical protein